MELPDSDAVNEDTTYTSGSDVETSPSTTDQANSNELETTADTTEDDGMAPRRSTRQRQAPDRYNPTWAAS